MSGSSGYRRVVRALRLAHERKAETMNDTPPATAADREAAREKFPDRDQATERNIYALGLAAGRAEGVAREREAILAMIDGRIVQMGRLGERTAESVLQSLWAAIRKGTP